MLRTILLISIFFVNTHVFASGYNVFAIGVYDVKFDGSETDPATDFRFEKRFKRFKTFCFKRF